MQEIRRAQRRASRVIGVKAAAAARWAGGSRLLGNEDPEKTDVAEKKDAAKTPFSFVTVYWWEKSSL